MTKGLIGLLSLLAACCINAQSAEPAAPLAKEPIPTLPPISVDKILTPEAAKHPHVCFVNVGSKVDAKLFREAAAAVSKLLRVYSTVETAQKLDPETILKRTDHNIRFGDKAVLVVYAVNNPEIVSFLNAPGKWALINISGLDRDKPEPERYRRRLQQMLLKGMAHACGVGATAESRCVMFSESFTLDGMDKTSVSYSPFAAFPIQNLLSTLGGEEIFIPFETPLE
jgi:hypothetical protein